MNLGQVVAPDGRIDIDKADPVQDDRYIPTPGNPPGLVTVREWQSKTHTSKVLYKGPLNTELVTRFAVGRTAMGSE